MQIKNLLRNNFIAHNPVIKKSRNQHPVVFQCKINIGSINFLSSRIMKFNIFSVFMDKNTSRPVGKYKFAFVIFFKAVNTTGIGNNLFYLLFLMKKLLLKSVYCK